MRRAMWRELETWPGWNCEPTAQIERVRVVTLHLQQARQFSTLPPGTVLITSSTAIMTSTPIHAWRLLMA
jgi:hypothetical protein